jgi:hypothetical protein
MDVWIHQLWSDVSSLVELVMAVLAQSATGGISIRHPPGSTGLVCWNKTCFVCIESASRTKKVAKNKWSKIGAIKQTLCCIKTYFVCRECKKAQKSGEKDAEQNWCRKLTLCCVTYFAKKRKTYCEHIWDVDYKPNQDLLLNCRSSTRNPKLKGQPLGFTFELRF